MPYCLQKFRSGKVMIEEKTIQSYFRQNMPENLQKMMKIACTDFYAKVSGDDSHMHLAWPEAAHVRVNTRRECMSVQRITWKTSFSRKFTLENVCPEV